MSRAYVCPLALWLQRTCPSGPRRRRACRARSIPRGARETAPARQDISPPPAPHRATQSLTSRLRPALQRSLEVRRAPL
jgi:hypothetical protein